MLCSIPGVIVVKGHDCVIESRTGLRAVFSAGMLAGEEEAGRSDQWLCGLLRRVGGYVFGANTG